MTGLNIRVHVPTVANTCGMIQAAKVVLLRAAEDAELLTVEVESILKHKLALNRLHQAARLAHEAIGLLRAEGKME